jgi:hypothetical protein
MPPSRGLVQMQDSNKGITAETKGCGFEETIGDQSDPRAVLIRLYDPKDNKKEAGLILFFCYRVNEILTYARFFANVSSILADLSQNDR